MNPNSDVIFNIKCFMSREVKLLQEEELSVAKVFNALISLWTWLYCDTCSIGGKIKRCNNQQMLWFYISNEPNPYLFCVQRLAMPTRGMESCELHKMFNFSAIKIECKMASI